MKIAFNRHLAVSCLALALAAGATPAPAQMRPSTVYAGAHTLTAVERGKALDQIEASLKSGYVLPEKVPAIVAALRAAQAKGRYDTEDTAVFSARLTEDLRAASGDGHLYLQFDPQRFAAASAAPAAEGSTSEVDELMNARARRDHYGLVEQKVLPGNLRYLKISGFEWIPDETGAAYDAAIDFLRGGDAVIVDLRGNGGGDHAAVRQLLSSLMPPDQLLMTFLEAGKAPVLSYTLADVRGGRMIGKPLYVLIDGGVASAGEDMAYTVQQFHLGKLVGAKTYGGANNNRLVPIAPGFMLSVSYGKPVQPVSGGNWEGVGVRPDVEIAPGKALAKAQVLALDELAAKAGGDPARRDDYAWARAGAAAELDPPALAESQLQARAGRYGEAVVVYRDGALWFTGRPGGPERRLVPLAADGSLFGMAGVESLRARFTAQGLETLREGDPNPRRFGAKAAH